MSEQSGMVNAYRCEDCGAVECTVNRHSGTTPFTLGCKKCNGFMQSGFYRLTSFNALRIAREFYYPTREEFDKLSPEVQDYVLDGAVLCRDLSTEPVLNKNTDSVLTLTQWSHITKEVYERTTKRLN